MQSPQSFRQSFALKTLRPQLRGGLCALIAATGVVTALLALTGCPSRQPPSAQGTADYFRFSEDFDPVYTRSTGQEEEHDYRVQAEAPDGTLRFQRLASAGGFVEADRTMMFQVDDESVSIVEFLDCLNACERLAQPQQILPWPIEGGEVASFDTVVTLIENSQEVGTQSESHRIAVGNAEEFSVPAGDFTGFDVLWTRTIEGESARTARLVVVPDVGFIKIEGWNGATMELKTAPEPLSE